MTISDFENIYLDYFNKVEFYAYYYLRDHHEAENVAQDTFVVLWKNIDKIREEVEIFPYLTVVARNICVNIIRKRITKNRYLKYNQPQLDTLLLDALMDSTATSIYSAEVNKILQEALDNMPQKIKSTFLMCRLNGLKYEEAAIAENISVKAIEYRISSALRILRRYFKDYMAILFLLICKWYE